MVWWKSESIPLTMKTRLLLVVALVVALGARAQGLVYFNNTPTTRISTNGIPGGGTGLTAPVANLFYYALYCSMTATTVLGATNALTPGGSGIVGGIFVFNDPNWTLVAYGTNSPFAAGRLASSQQNSDGFTVVPDVPGGSAAHFVVLGWSANLGSTVAALQGSLFSGFAFGSIGESAVSGSYLLGNGSFIPAPVIFGTGPSQISGFTLALVPIPEPTALALVLTGGVGFFFCRRKAN